MPRNRPWLRREVSVRHVLRGHAYPAAHLWIARRRWTLGPQGSTASVRLIAGTCAGFKAGASDGHQLANRGSRPAVYLEVGTRDDADTVVYPDVDLAWNPSVDPDRFTHRDGTPY